VSSGARASRPGRPFWVERRDELCALAARGTPLYVLDARTARERALSLLELGALARVLYAVKANDHPALLRLFDELGLGFECVSAGELEHVRETLGAGALERSLFTPNFAPRAEIARALELGARWTLDGLHAVEAWPDLVRSRELFARFDPGAGSGHHAHVRTAGESSKFGCEPPQAPALAARSRALGASIVGLHVHVGSGILAATQWEANARFLCELAPRFPAARVLDLGGGLGVPASPQSDQLDLAQLGTSLRRFRDAHAGFELWLEPGRYLAAEAGALLVRATQVKQKGGRTFVGVDAGMNALVRPALYGAWHPIANLTRLDERPALVADVVGPICEAGDILGRERSLPATREGDVLVIGSTGAYGRVMASRYNRREVPDEIWLEP
jgi:diaminopimelate decarboxylase/aspartate kinase